MLGCLEAVRSRDCHMSRSSPWLSRVTVIAVLMTVTCHASSNHITINYFNTNIHYHYCHVFIMLLSTDHKHSVTGWYDHIHIFIASGCQRPVSVVTWHIMDLTITTQKAVLMKHCSNNLPHMIPVAHTTSILLWYHSLRSELARGEGTIHLYCIRYDQICVVAIYVFTHLHCLKLLFKLSYYTITRRNIHQCKPFCSFIILVVQATCMVCGTELEYN